MFISCLWCQQMVCGLQNSHVPSSTTILVWDSVQPNPYQWVNPKLRKEPHHANTQRLVIPWCVKQWMQVVRKVSVQHLRPDKQQHRLHSSHTCLQVWACLLVWERTRIPRTLGNIVSTIALSFIVLTFIWHQYSDMDYFKYQLGPT